MHRLVHFEAISLLCVLEGDILGSDSKPEKMAVKMCASRL